MIKTIYDTNVYIDWMNNKLDDKILFRKGTLIFISSIVIMELRAGAITDKSVSVIEKFYKSALKTKRYITPTLSDFLKAGETLNLLMIEKGYNIKGASNISNDILIALSSRQSGAMLRTSNAKDFEVINSYINFNWKLIE